MSGLAGYESFESILHKFHQFVMEGLMELDVMKLDFLLFVIEDNDGLMVELPDDGFRKTIPKNLIAADGNLAEQP